MRADLILLCHASTRATRSASFPADEPLDGAGEAAAVAASRGLPAADVVWCAPSIAAQQTASALGLQARVEPAIRDADVGRWAGQAIADVARDEPDGFSVWRTDPNSRPHGGEALSDVFDRVGAWVDARRQAPGRTIAVTHSAVIRAAVIRAVDGTASTFWHLDVGPLSETWLRSDGRRWTLRSLQP
jgi:broad specificity phosphatase PhoE